jgi:hypothetical protein
METHVVGTYPMYLTEKVLKVENEIQKEILITCYSENKINVGDLYQHKIKYNEFKVSEVISEKFPALGNHKKEVYYYSLRLTK